MTATAARHAPTTAESCEMDPFMGWMLGQAGLDMRAYRPSAMQRRLPACLRRLRAATPQSAQVMLERKPELLPFALNTILIGVSDFFRDTAVFEHIERTLLPDMLRTRAGLRVCSVGASGGHELYSMAMLLAENRALETSALLGIDCRSDAIARATDGHFSAEDVAGVNEERRRRFFRLQGERWRIADELREAVRWQHADLFSFRSEHPWDVILFRNVSIYFSADHAENAWQRLADQLVPGGFLVTGKAEKPPPPLQLVRVASSIYQKPHS